MRIPLYNRLKRRIHRETALMQDELVEAVYSLEESAVLHGGTAIWRCYQGNRFSEDLDFVFLPKKGFGQGLRKAVASLGMELVKFKETGNTVYAKASREKITVSVEVGKRKYAKSIVKEFEKIDGSAMDALTLGAEDLLLEKLLAFRDRKLIRDLYDVHYLGRFAEGNKEFRQKVFGLLGGLPKAVDEKNLRNLVLVGAVPNEEQMVNALRARFKD